VVVGLRVRVRPRGEGASTKKTRNRARRLGFGCAVSNGDVGRWREVVGWCGQGGGGGAHAHSDAHEGGGGHGQKTRKPSHYGSVLGGSGPQVGGGWFCGGTGPPAAVI
jgi:hypothetical protein